MGEGETDPEPFEGGMGRLESLTVESESFEATEGRTEIEAKSSE